MNATTEACGHHLMLWMAEVLNLGLREFSDADQAGPGRNFIPV